MPGGRPAGRPERTSARALCSAAVSARTTSAPTLPVAPVTRNISLPVSLIGNDPYHCRSPMTPASDTRSRRTAAQTREHVLAVAHELFFRHGIPRPGVDAIAAAAGVAPTTLYRLFASKDDLIAAYIERADRLYQEWFTGVVEAAGADPRARILALFDALAEQVQPHQCRGCPFLMALAEI